MVGSGDAAAWPGGIEAARATVDTAMNSTLKAAMSERSRRVMTDPGERGVAVRRRPASRLLRGGPGVQEVGGQREQREQDDEDDRELPQPALDAAAAAIHRRVATERAAEARPAGLEQDREAERDGDDQLAGGQNGVHERGTSLDAAPDGSTGTASSRERPVISGHGWTPARSRMVGATSARTPSWRVRPANAGPIP